MYESEFEYYERAAANERSSAKSEAALAGSCAEVAGGIIGLIISLIFLLIKRFDLLSSALASLLFYMITCTKGWNKAVYIGVAIAIFLVSMILQHALITARVIYTVFVCVAVSLIGGMWKDYDTEMQRNMVMLICFGVTALLGIISWVGISKSSKGE